MGRDVGRLTRSAICDTGSCGDICLVFSCAFHRNFENWVKVIMETVVRKGHFFLLASRECFFITGLPKTKPHFAESIAFMCMVKLSVKF